MHFLPLLLLPLGLASAGRQSHSTPWQDPRLSSLDTAKCGSYPRQYCAGTEFNMSLTRRYVCGDYRLGPVQLPQNPPLENFFDLYTRFGGVCPGEFLTQFWNNNTNWWNYPNNLGYTMNENFEPIKGEIQLQFGTLVDRFGGEGGNFTAPAGTGYRQRSLPPTNLEEPDDEYPVYPYEYHLYRVMKPLPVYVGPVAPWFNQPGQGVQYETFTTIGNLVGQGFLKRVNPKVLLTL